MKKLAKQTRSLKTLDSQQLAQTTGGAAKSVVETIHQLLNLLSF